MLDKTTSLGDIIEVSVDNKPQQRAGAGEGERRGSFASIGQRVFTVVTKEGRSSASRISYMYYLNDVSVAYF